MLLQTNTIKTTNIHIKFENLPKPYCFPFYKVFYMYDDGTINSYTL